ncbi:MAG: DNA translocase FtsK 4TM domain-containing protein, partial [Deltaproteobacteria bacterium]|nr:DNA translocase FtsK 4TM domain-containing protein [Deltaproteobacteria bacterium]
MGREILGILLMGAGLFLGVALFSYHPSDPSFNVQ